MKIKFNSWSHRKRIWKKKGDPKPLTKSEQDKYLRLQETDIEYFETRNRLKQMEEEIDMGRIF